MDRRLIPRLYLQAGLSLLFAVSGWALLADTAVPLLAGVAPNLPTGTARVVGALHLIMATAVFIPPARRPAVAFMVATLLAWMAFLGATRRPFAAFVTGALVPVTLGAGPAADEGPFRPRARSMLEGVLWAAGVVGLGSGAWLLMDGIAASAALAAAVFHYAALRRMGARRNPGALLALWSALFVAAPWAVHRAAQEGTPLMVAAASGTVALALTATRWWWAGVASLILAASMGITVVP